MAGSGPSVLGSKSRETDVHSDTYAAFTHLDFALIQAWAWDVGMGFPFKRTKCASLDGTLG